MRYKIIRYYLNRRRVIKSGLTLQEAEKHCNNPETSYRTCTSAAGKRRTRLYGMWFDGYTAE